MKDQPESNQAQDDSNDHLTKTPVSAEAHSKSPETNEPEPSAYQEGDPPYEIMRALEEIHQGIKKPKDFVFKCLRKHHAVVTALSTLTIAALTGFYACYSHRQWVEMRTSAEAAKSAADTAARELSLSERPWVSSTPIISSPFWMDENGANLVLKFEMHNTGCTPAIGAFTYAKFFPLSGTPEKSESQEKETCDSAISVTKSSDETLFPGFPANKEVKFNWPPDKLAQNSQHGFLSIQIVTCTAYRSSYSNVIYSSGQIYNFYRLGPNGMNLAFEVGKTVPPENIHIGIDSERVTLVEGNYKVH